MTDLQIFVIGLGIFIIFFFLQKHFLIDKYRGFPNFSPKKLGLDTPSGGSE